MQNLDNLKNRLISDANKEKEIILAEAKVNSDLILDTYKTKIAAYIREKELERTNVENEKRRLFKVTSDLKRRDAILKHKGELIREVLLELPNEIRKLDKARYASLISSLIIEGAPKGEVRLVPSSRDAGLFDDEFIVHINSLLASLSKETNIILDKETRDILGGCILVTKNMEVDCSVEALLKTHEEELTQKLASSLF